jgi:hypothetical protein
MHQQVPKHVHISDGLLRLHKGWKPEFRSIVRPAEAAKQSEGVAPAESKPAIKPVETVPLPKRVEHEPRERAKSPDDGYCAQHYRSYDPASGTYTSYDGRRLPCR